MMKWQPDTCDCLVSVADDWASGTITTPCRLHAGKTFADVLAHNRGFNDMSKYKSNKKADKPVIGVDADGNDILGDSPSELHQMAQCLKAKSVERERIRNLR